ncbi:short-chain dehydrogenase (plasmid) [Frondihabitans sp. PAMC 28766]|uniref:SDR family NAD(P)-dependent oxidoreductase n=1 Tax=Frondihabitans sp. PAMC 28766 TaxID=1795630 RepID=UPI00078BCCF2|nr:SDR family NAD(P)-dependent oxidoreductase [Frondihabitans sp. PAMC 28766]AMM22889.1 short-chain dehydrogenase [Frondihabitans sp. PAMC 28766]
MPALTTPSTWFVTGASRGLGLELVTQLLTQGHNVAATTRSVGRLEKALDAIDTARLLPLAVDLSDETAVIDAVTAAKGRFGSLDVVVNNAGYGFLGAVEEVTDLEARQMFDVQIFGVWNVLRAVLPDFRASGSGHIINISSILGLTTFPGWGLYCAGKYALEGLTGSLAQEVAEFGIRVNLVEPGYMQTDFLTANSLGLPTSTADGYAAVRDMTAAHQAMPGTQLGDPAKAAAAIIRLAEDVDTPLHQLLGSDSLGIASGALEALAAEIEQGRELAMTTDILQA